MSWIALSGLIRREEDDRSPRQKRSWPFASSRFAPWFGCAIFAASFLMSTAQAFAHGSTIKHLNTRTLHSSVLRTVPAPACDEISTLWVFVLVVTAAILLCELLTFSVIRFHSRPSDEEPLLMYATAQSSFRGADAHRRSPLSVEAFSGDYLGPGAGSNVPPK